MTQSDIALPELTGSDKQVAWANKIRADLMPAVDAEIARLLRKAANGDTDEAQAVAAAWRAEIANQADASWWIDNRYNRSAAGIVRKAQLAVYDRYMAAQAQGDAQ